MSGLGSGFGKLLQRIPQSLKVSVMDYLAKMVTDANAILDIQTGALKSGATSMVEGVLKTLGETLSNETIPTANSIFPKNANIGPEETYFSYEMAMRLTKDSEKSLTSLRGISHKLGDYRNQSVEFGETFFKLVKDYSKLFSIFIKDRKFLFFHIGTPSFKKVLGVRKDMKACLKEMERCLNKYVGYGYTFNNISAELKQAELGLSELSSGSNMKRAIALTIFWKVCHCLASSGDYFQSLGDGDERYARLDADPKLRDEYRKALKEGLRLTEGVDPKKVVEFGKEDKQKFVERFIDQQNAPGGNNGALGWAQCNYLAEEAIGDSSIKNISSQKVDIRSPLWGDYAEQLLACVKYTLKHLNDVIYLGSGSKKKDEMQVSDGGKISADGASFDLTKLVGQNFGDTTAKELAARQKRIMKKINQETAAAALKEYHKCEKSYSKISKSYRSEENLNNACVDLPPTTSESGEKQYNLKEHWETIKNLHKAMREDKENKDLSLQMQRKTQRFMRACAIWDKAFSENKRVAKKKEAADKAWASELIREAKDHYKSLMKKYADNRGAKASIDLIYKAIPNSASKFIQDGGYEKNKERVDEFLEQEEF